MAAAELTEVSVNSMHLVPLVIKAQVTTQGDWIVLDGFKGVVPIAGQCQSIAAASSGQEVFTYGVMTINNAGVAYSATSTSLVTQTATITRVMPYYVITASGEIMEVLTDSNVASTTPTITVRRGLFGTTASATGLADTNVIGIMNILFLGFNCVGPHLIVALPLPNNPFNTIADGGVR